VRRPMRSIGNGGSVVAAGLVIERTFRAASPIGRVGEPEEMVGMVLHLCSDEASFADGQVFIMDGSQTSH
jgi:NAD(P)-dependent dehydrogenase (short-subunit alcohol dehydrogenase family)